MSRVEKLAPADVHLWLLDASSPAADAHLAEAEALLSDDERALLARASHPGRRREVLLGRWLVRTRLSLYAARAPAAWRFTRNAHGCPAIDPPEGALHFNLSHTHGLIACVIARAELGVDVEWTHRRGRTLQVADRYFSSGELAALRALPTQAQPSRFFDLWTLKESYIKARGMGLALPLGKFTFSFEGTSPRLTCAPELGDDGETWRFFLLSPTAGHRAAVAARLPAADLTVRWAP